MNAQSLSTFLLWIAILFIAETEIQSFAPAVPRQHRPVTALQQQSKIDLNDITSRMDKPRLIPLPQECELINFDRNQELLNKREDFLNELVNPSSKYYELIKSKLEPLLLSYPYEKMLQLNIPFIARSELKLDLYKKEIMKFEPKIKLQAKEARQVGLEMSFDHLRMDFYYKIVRQESFLGRKSDEDVSILHVTVNMEDPVFNIDLNMDCLDCQGTSRFARFRHRMGHLVRATQGFLAYGSKGMKMAALRWIYDAKAKDVKFTYGKVDISAAVNNNPTKDREPEEMLRRVPGLVDLVSAAANGLFNQKFKHEMERGVAKSVKEQIKHALEHLRPYFYGYSEKEHVVRTEMEQPKLDSKSWW